MRPTPPPLPAVFPTMSKLGAILMSIVVVGVGVDLPAIAPDNLFAAVGEDLWSSHDRIKIKIVFCDSLDLPAIGRGRAFDADDEDLWSSHDCITTVVENSLYLHHKASYDCPLPIFPRLIPNPSLGPPLDPYPFLDPSLDPSSSSKPDHAHQQSGVDARSVLLSVGFIYFLPLLVIVAACFHAYSVFQGLHGRPVEFLSAIQSIVTSFPLLPTLIRTHFFAFSIFLLRIFWVFIFKGAEFVIGHEISYSSPYFPYLLEYKAYITGTLAWNLASLQGQWVLADVIVMAQLMHGVSPLWGMGFVEMAMRREAWLLTKFFGVLFGVLVWATYQWNPVVRMIIMEILIICVHNGVNGMQMVLILAATMVLYMNRATLDELAMEIR